MDNRVYYTDALDEELRELIAHQAIDDAKARENDERQADDQDPDDPADPDLYEKKEDSRRTKEVEDGGRRRKQAGLTGNEVKALLDDKSRKGQPQSPDKQVQNPPMSGKSTRYQFPKVIRKFLVGVPSKMHIDSKQAYWRQMTTKFKKLHGYAHPEAVTEEEFMAYASKTGFRPFSSLSNLEKKSLIIQPHVVSQLNGNNGEVTGSDDVAPLEVSPPSTPPSPGAEAIFESTFIGMDGLVYETIFRGTQTETLQELAESDDRALITLGTTAQPQIYVAAHSSWTYSDLRLHLQRFLPRFNFVIVRQDLNDFVVHGVHLIINAIGIGGAKKNGGGGSAKQKKQGSRQPNQGKKGGPPQNRPRRKAIMAEQDDGLKHTMCTMKMMYALANVFGVGANGACISSSSDNMPTIKSRVEREFTLTSASSGDAAFFITGGVANDSVFGYATTGSWTGAQDFYILTANNTTGWTRIYMPKLPLSSTQITTQQGADGNNTRKSKIVAIGVSIQYIGRADSMCGSYTLLHDLSHSNLAFSPSATTPLNTTVAQDMNGARVVRISEREEVLTCFAVEEGEQNFATDEDGANFQVYPYCDATNFPGGMTDVVAGASVGCPFACIIVEGCPSAAFQVKIVMHIESCGSSFDGGQPNSADPDGGNLALKAAHRVQEELGDTNKRGGWKLFREGLTALTKHTVQYAVPVAETALLSMLGAM